ncbi:MAG: hypothetical protein A2114_01085 [Candidatus Vogelbacteria bacterium GWA1_51_14]|uniref:Uncharacterized protein n=1 Tax=Candidatus Vogelbacteria bacterium GWA1_51_14 TaxID=1802435 RepID=A0A1G2QBA5_9BACT|nr:MAG: hypothetical protein A2114_01085 [Candidatus Vogelbacteria bacterium GWA1_51_14]
MGFFFISLRSNISPSKLVVTGFLIVSFIILPTAALAQTAVAVSVNNTSLIMQLLALINQLLEQLKSLQAKLAAQQAGEGIFAPTPLPVPTPTPTPVPTPPPAPRLVPQPEPTPAPIGIGTLNVAVLNGLARCLAYPCEIPVSSREVKVVATNSAGVIVGSAVTTTGYATLKLPAGSYTITASADGYNGFVSNQASATVVANQSSEVKLTLNTY